MNLHQIIALTFAYYHPEKVISDSIVKIYAEDLSDLPEADVIAAYSSYRRNPKNVHFPLPAKIRELICPEQFISPEDQATEIAARITAAIPRFGYTNGADAQKFIGPEGWSVVMRQGGWAYLCEHHGTRINPSTFQAQIRKQIEVSVKYGEGAVAHAIGAAPTRQESGLMSAGEIVKQLTAKTKAMGGE